MSCNVTSTLCAPDGTIVLVDIDLGSNVKTYTTPTGVPWTGNPQQLQVCAPEGWDDCHCVVVSANSGNVLNLGTDDGAYLSCTQINACVTPPTIVSQNAGNVLQLGTDGGAYISCASIEACDTGGDPTTLDLCAELNDLLLVGEPGPGDIFFGFDGTECVRFEFPTINTGATVPDLVVTVNGGTGGVTQSGTSNHEVDITLLSTGTFGNDLGFGLDGGLTLNVCDVLANIAPPFSTPTLGSSLIGLDQFGNCVRFNPPTGSATDVCTELAAIPLTETLMPAGATIIALDPDGNCARYYRHIEDTITTNGNLNGVSFANNNWDLTTLSAGAGNDLTLGGDGGLYLNVCNELSSQPYFDTPTGDTRIIALDSFDGTCVRMPWASFDICEQIKDISPATGTAVPGTGIELVGINTNTGLCERYFPPTAGTNFDLCASIKALPLPNAVAEAGDRYIGIDVSTGECVRFNVPDLCSQLQALPLVGAPETGDRLFGLDVSTGNCVRFTHSPTSTFDLCPALRALPYFDAPTGDTRIIGLDSFDGSCVRLPWSAFDLCSQMFALPTDNLPPAEEDWLIGIDSSTSNCKKFKRPVERISKTVNYLGNKIDPDGRVYPWDPANDCIYSAAIHRDHILDCISVDVKGDTSPVAQTFTVRDETGAFIASIVLAANDDWHFVQAGAQTLQTGPKRYCVTPSGMSATNGSTITSVTIEWKIFE